MLRRHRHLRIWFRGIKKAHDRVARARTRARTYTYTHTQTKREREKGDDPRNEPKYRDWKPTLSLTTHHHQTNWASSPDDAHARAFEPWSKLRLRYVGTKRILLTMLDILVTEGKIVDRSELPHQQFNPNSFNWLVVGGGGLGGRTIASRYGYGWWVGGYDTELQPRHPRTQQLRSITPHYNVDSSHISV